MLVSIILIPFCMMLFWHTCGFFETVSQVVFHIMTNELFKPTVLVMSLSANTSSVASH